MKALPEYVAGMIREYFAKKHPDAHFQVAEISVPALAPGRLRFREISFRSDRGDSPEWDVRVADLTVEVDLLPLMKGEVRMGRVRIQDPIVRFRPRSSDRPAPRPKPPRFEIRSARIEGGSFEMESFRLENRQITLDPLSPDKPRILARTLGRVGGLDLGGELNLPFTGEPIELDLRFENFEGVTLGTLSVKGDEAMVGDKRFRRESSTPFLAFLLNAIARAVRMPE